MSDACKQVTAQTTQQLNPMPASAARVCWWPSHGRASSWRCPSSNRCRSPERAPCGRRAPQSAAWLPAQPEARHDLALSVPVL